MRQVSVERTTATPGGEVDPTFRCEAPGRSRPGGGRLAAGEAGQAGDIGDAGQADYDH